MRSFIRRHVNALVIRHSKRHRGRKAKPIMQWYLNDYLKGIRYKFNFVPIDTDTDKVTALSKYYYKNSGELSRIIRHYQQLHRFLLACGSLEIRRPNPLEGMPGREGRATHEVHTVTPAMLEYVFQMRLALAHYATMVSEHQDRPDFVMEATQKVAAVIQPIEWQPHFELPHTMHDAAWKIKLFLNAVVEDASL
jgi:hypothetical protein